MLWSGLCDSSSSIRVIREYEAYPDGIEFRRCSKSRKIMQSLTLTRYPTPISPPRLNLYQLRQIAAPVLSAPTAFIDRRGMTSRRESASFKSLAVGRTSTGDDDDGYCTLLDFAGNRGGEGTNVGDDLVVLLYHLQHACKRIASLVASPFNSSLGKLSVNSSSGSDRDVQQTVNPGYEV